jgi:hypothetical protein
MLFIAKRSDSKDGAVPPEPVGPMEVAGCKRQDGRRMLNFIDRFKSPPCIRQHPSEIVTVFLTQDPSVLGSKSSNAVSGGDH